MAGSAFDPIHIPDWVWRQNAAALRARDVGAFFHLAKKYAGASQNRIAAATGIPQPRISALMNHTGGPIETLEVFERVADGLHMPDQARLLLGIAPREAPGVLAATSASVAEVSGESSTLIRRLHAAKAVDTGLVAVLCGETETIRLLDRRLGNLAAADKMRAHITQVDAALRHCLTSGIRRGLADVLADSSALAGWQAIDTGDLTTAWDHFERAKLAAREAENYSLLAFAQGEQAYVLLDMNSQQDARDLITDAYSTYGRRVPARLRAWLKMAEAEIAAGHAASTNRDETACRQALEIAARLLPSTAEDPELPYLALNSTHLARWRGNCLVHFGDPDTVNDLRNALGGMQPGSFARAEAALRCDLASALLAHGEQSEARTEVKRASQLADLTGSIRQQRRIDQLEARITALAS